MATPKFLLENALIAEKEGQNVEPPHISKQSLRLRFSNGEGNFRARGARSAVVKTAPVEGNESDDVSKKKFSGREIIVRKKVIYEQFLEGGKII